MSALTGVELVGGGVGTQSCCTCRWEGHISRDCPQRVRLDVQATRGVKDSGRVRYGPVERRIGPNEKGWLEPKNTFFDDETVWKTMEEVEQAMGPLGA